jgi:hypothetical protein
MTAPTTAAPTQRLFRGLLVSMVLNALVPVLLYQFAKRYFAASELAALSAAAMFPLAWSVVDLLRVGSLDPVAVLSLVSIVVSMIAVLLGGSPKLLLIRESFFTGAFGLACFVSLCAPRPIMFYFSRYFTAGRDAARIADFDRGWQRPGFRRTMRLITIVWGATSLVEFAVRIALVYTLPAATVLVVSPIVLGGLLLVTISWTFAYGKRMRARAEAQLPTAGLARPPVPLS